MDDHDRHFENLEHRHRVLFEQVQDLKQLHDKLTTEHRKLWGELTAARQLWNDHMDQFHGDDDISGDPAKRSKSREARLMSIKVNLPPHWGPEVVDEVSGDGEDLEES